MELVQFPLSHPGDTLVFPAELTPEDSFGLLVTERPNHDSRILLHHVKRNTGALVFHQDSSPSLERCQSLFALAPSIESASTTLSMNRSVVLRPRTGR